MLKAVLIHLYFYFYFKITQAALYNNSNLLIRFFNLVLYADRLNPTRFIQHQKLKQLSKNSLSILNATRYLPTAAGRRINQS